MPQRSSFSSSPMVLLLLCTVIRGAFGFHYGSISPTHMRRAMSSLSLWALPLSPSSSSSSSSSSFLSASSSSSSSSSFSSSSMTTTTARSSPRHSYPFPFMLCTSTALFASSTASSGAGKKKKAASSKSKAPVKKVTEVEEEDENEMTEAELLKVMQSGEAMDAVWQRMMSQMKRTGALEYDDDEEEEEEEEDEVEDEEEDDDGDNEDNAEEGFSDNDDSDDDNDSDAEKIDAMDRKRGLHSSVSSFSSSSSQDEEENNNLGTIQIRNSQRSVALDMDVLHNHIRGIMEIIGKNDHDVSLWLTNDRSIREYNDRYRGKRSATDILSFPFHEYKSPDVPTPESVALNGQIKDLGDMMVSTGYVQRQCARDQADWIAEGENQWSEERGASGAMARVYDVQGRLPYLVIHGVLHLLGYDHETEMEYEEMVRVEERVISEFVRRFPEAAPPVDEPRKTKERKVAAATVRKEGGKARKKASGAGATTTTTAAVKSTATAAASSTSKARLKKTASTSDEDKKKKA